MSWDEIKIVGIGYMPIKQPGRPKMIYFSADGISCPILYGRVVDKSFYMINYRKMIVEEIRKYWLKEIDGLESKSDFEKRSNMKKKLT